MKIFLETERLILRELLPTDATGMLELDSNPNVLQYLGIQPITTLAECRQTIRHVRDQYARNGIGRWAVTLKSSGTFIGWAGLKYIDDTTINGRRNFYDLGYRFIEEYWRNGYGYEAAQASVDFGFKLMKLPKISAYLDPENEGSMRILKKCNLQYVE
ncbi:MAG: GNAT family N-acetyltransferase, partial [Bacteroidota bacterium]